MKGGAGHSLRGFTLLEILLALALVGLVLVGLNTFIFSMGELWGRNSDVRLFDQHVNAVTRFLEQQLRTAALPPAARANATPIGPKEVTPSNGALDKLITFELPSGCRIISWPDRPLPEVVCSLQVREHVGLFLLWHSRLETRFDTDPPHETLLTPFVTALAYDYFDTTSRNWTTQTILKSDVNGQPLAPQRIHLTFTYGKLSRQTTVAVPTTLQGMPNF
jgi:prepilin-type N-terminal cleavage/methylation domain-containing protein